MATELALVLAVVIAVGYALARWFPETTQRWFNRARTARSLLFGAAAIVIAIVLVSSGSVLLVLVGGLMLLYGVLWVLFDRPAQSLMEEV